jgi:uncharacterized protein (DUF1697 family)
VASVAAFFRGINVGGNNKLPMSDLVQMFQAAGATDVRAYVQSGNVIFDPPKRGLDGLAERIAAAVRAKFGHAPLAIFRTQDELHAILEANPFLRRNADFARLHVLFLAEEPSAERLATLDPDRSPGDEYTVSGNEIFLYTPAGLGHSKLTNAYFDAKLKTVSTARNWRTVIAVTEMMQTTPRTT